MHAVASAGVPSTARATYLKRRSSHMPPSRPVIRNRIRARLHHATAPDKEFGVRIYREPFEQRLQFGPQPVAAQGCDQVELRKLSCRDLLGEAP